MHDEFLFWLFPVGWLSAKFIGGIVAYKSPILLKGAHDKVVVSLVDPPATSPLASEATKPSSGDVGSSDLEELKISGLSAKERIGA